MANAKFFQGLVANLPVSSVEGALYFTKDENIYLGIADGKYKRYGDFNLVDNIAALPQSGANSNALYYCKEENVLARYDKGTSKWVQINPNTNTTYTIEAGSANGTIKLVGSDDSSIEIGVTGLGSAAYTESSAYAQATHQHEMSDVNGLDAAIADAKKAGTDAQALIGEVEEEKTVVQMIAEAKEAVTYDDTAIKQSIATLNGSDTGKSVRTIANEELAAQLIPEEAKESLDTLSEIAAWIQSHPDDAASMNQKISALETLVGSIPEDATSDTVVAYIKEYCDAAIAALRIGDYAKATELTAAVARITTVEGKLRGIEEGAQVNKIEVVKVNGAPLEVSDKAVDIAVPTGTLASKNQVSEGDLDSALAEKVNAASEGNHSHVNKDVLDGITSAKVQKWDAAQANVIEAITSDTLEVGEISGKSVAINIVWGTF